MKLHGCSGREQVKTDGNFSLISWPATAVPMLQTVKHTCLVFQSSGAFHRNWLRLPSLFLYSRADPIGVADIIEGVMEKWRLQDVSISYKCWDHSPHVSHFHHHPDEYVETLLAFLDSLGLSTPEHHEGERDKEVLQQTLQQAQPVREQQHRK